MDEAKAREAILLEALKSTKRLLDGATPKNIQSCDGFYQINGPMLDECLKMIRTVITKAEATRSWDMLLTEEQAIELIGILKIGRRYLKRLEEGSAITPNFVPLDREKFDAAINMLCGLAGKAET